MRMFDPLVSIVIPVYNGSNYLSEAIDSALAQTYRNCEIIVVNDGSSDATEQIGFGYGDRIRYFHKENGGVATALNLGIEKMRGEYFSWLSHDDVYYPRKIESQISALLDDGDFTKIIFGDFDVNYQATGKRTAFVLKERADEALLTKSVYPVVRSLISGCSLLIHRSHFERVGVFNPDLLYVQDYDLWFRLFHGQRTLYLNELMYTVRNHSLQGTQAKRSEMRREEIELWRMYTTKLSNDEMAESFGSTFLFLFEMFYRIASTSANGMDLDEELIEKLISETSSKRIDDKMKEWIVSVCNGNEFPVVIFGAGFQGIRTCHLLRFCGIRPHCFVDNDTRKQGRDTVDGIQCIPFDEISDRGDELALVVAIDEPGSVIEQLHAKDFRYVLTHRQCESKLREIG